MEERALYLTAPLERVASFAYFEEISSDMMLECKGRILSLKLVYNIDRSCQGL